MRMHGEGLKLGVEQCSWGRSSSISVPTRVQSNTEGIWSWWCTEGNHSNNRIQAQISPFLALSQPPSVMTTHTNGLAEEMCPLPGINTAYLSLYSFLHPVFSQRLQDTQKEVKHTKRSKKKSCCQETRGNKPDSEMTPILELPDKGFKITVVNTLKPLVEKVNKLIQNFSREKL